MMSISDILFSLLRNELGSEAFNGMLQQPVSDEIFAGLYKLSKAHDLAHLVGDALEKNGLLPKDSPARKKFLQERDMAIYRYEQINYELEEICRILEEEKIEHVPLKGSVLRKYYPEPWMRTSCDIDVLIKKEDLETAIQVLEKEGFQYEETQTHDAQMWAPSGVHFELHFDLIEEGVVGKSAAVLSQAWARGKACEGWTYRLEFDGAFFYFYHIAHMAKHFLNGGCGIRSFLDIWILRQKELFQGEETQSLLQQAGLSAFAQNAEKLSNVWFGTAEHDETTKEMEDYIVGAGVYGTLDNQIALKQIKIGGKKQHLLSRIFLPYSLLKASYPKLEKYPILFPFYQVARWFRIVFGKNKKRAFKELKSIASTKDERKERLLALCNDLGLKK